MKPLAGLVLLVLGVCSAALAGTTPLVVNGSFEAPALGPATFMQMDTIPGWTGSAGIEIQSNGVLGAGQVTPFGNQYAELDVESASTLSQTITTVPGGHYLLSFDFSARPASGTNTLRVDFSGAAPANFSAPDTGSTEFRHFTETLVASGSESVLSFTPIKPTGGAGVLLDNVSVTGTAAVPLPAAFWPGAAVLGTTLLFNQLRLRRRRRSSTSTPV